MEDDIKKELKFIKQCLVRLTTAVKTMNEKYDETIAEIKALTQPQIVKTGDIPAEGYPKAYPKKAKEYEWTPWPGEGGRTEIPSRLPDYLELERRVMQRGAESTKAMQEQANRQYEMERKKMFQKLRGFLPPILNTSEMYKAMLKTDKEQKEEKDESNRDR